MEKELSRAIELRNSGNHKESNEELIKLVQEYPENGQVNYQCAWSFDLVGEESKAVPFSKKRLN
ncbi:hypothetical protein KIS4809_2925 [Bacillus sp. ZZV12-4809]|nr:hypothetical protein KIS4809_2925 [Bacillus sp. ZZV12-4809]